MQNQPLVECVPNFSEGRDPAVLKQITDVIEAVEGVKLLDVDPGKATNRTVVTFVGAPEPVIEAAFQAMKKASEVIDMSKHSGEHSRMGATDVCPLIPIANITMEEVAEWAHKLAKRAGEELGIPIYMYESAATKPAWRNLATVRSGEYEALPDKLGKPEWKPDYGPAKFNATAGATAVGARDFLIAYNVNLNTTSVRRANSVAFDVREQGRVKREGGEVSGAVLKDENGNALREPGKCKGVKGIGWYIEEYGIAQLSLNLTNINITPVHKAFDEACERARERGIRVTGSEIVGLMPLRCLTEAADYFLRKQERSLGISESEKVKIAVKSLGLDDLGPFDARKKVIEYMIEDGGAQKLAGLSLTEFAEKAASESPAPGGGSVSAYCGVLAASMGTMVANLSSHKRGWDHKWEFFSEYAEKGQALITDLLKAVDDDTAAFNRIMEAYGMPKGNESEAAERKKAISDATRHAALVPLQIARLASETFDISLAMAEEGNPNSVTDAGVGALCARAAVKGAAMNVRVNLMGFEDEKFVKKTIEEIEKLERRADEKEKEVTAAVLKAIK
jgi:glutamate formiminotransferase/formiminotetrahydrofolate cyclodeaminase